MNRIIVVLTLIFISISCFSQEMRNHVFSTRAINNTGTTNCPGWGFCKFHSACILSTYFFISFDNDNGQYYYDVFIADKDMDYDYIAKMPHTLKLKCKKGGNIIREGKVYYKKEPTYITGYSDEVHDNYSVTVTSPHDGSRTYNYDVKYNDPSRTHPEYYIKDPGEILMRFPITKEEYDRIMSGIKKIEISNFTNYKFYKETGSYLIKTSSSFRDLIKKQFSDFHKCYGMCQ